MSSVKELQTSRQQMYKELEPRLKEWRDSQNTKLDNFHNGALVPAFILFVRQHCGAGTAVVLNLLWKGVQAQAQKEDTAQIRQDIQNHLASGSDNILHLSEEDFDSEDVDFSKMFDEECTKILTSPDRNPCLAAFRCEIEEYMKIHVKYRPPRERKKIECSLF